MIGEQIFDANGKRWTLLLGNAAQCRLEEMYDKGFFAVVADAVPMQDITPEMLADPAKMIELARGLRVSVLRDIAWAGLQRHHPELTIDEVSDLIDALGQAEFGEIIGAAIAGTRDHGEDGGGNAPGKKTSPRRTRARGPTGRR